MVEQKEKLGVTYIFITHDLSLAWVISDRIAVMYLGRIVEIGDTEEVVANPKHPYTKALISVIPVPDPLAKREHVILQGETPNPVDIPERLPLPPALPRGDRGVQADRPARGARRRQPLRRLHQGERVAGRRMMARSRARVPVTRKRRSPARHDPDAGTRRGDEAQTPPSGPRPNREKGFAPDIMLSDLPVTAQNILAAARHILERDGFRGLTYEAIAAESGEYKDSVRYHFGGKAGLLAALVDATTHDASLQIYAQGRGLKKPADRLRAVIQASRSLPGSESYAVMWELSPQILRDRALRNRVAQLYEWYRGHYVERPRGRDRPRHSTRCPGLRRAAPGDARWACLPEGTRSRRGRPRSGLRPVVGSRHVVADP